MSFNNYKPDVAVVYNATPTDAQITALLDLGLCQQCDLTNQHFVVFSGGLKSFGSQSTDSIEYGLELERRMPAYPEYVKSDSVFDTIDDLIEALKP